MCSSELGRFGCFDASSAMDATTTTPAVGHVDRLLCLARVADRAERLLDHVGAESIANSTPAANRPPSAMNESLTRMGMKRQPGQPPTSPEPSSAALESLASPVPWPYSTVSSGLLSP